MNFSIERPWALYGFLLLIPVLIYTVVVFKKTTKALCASYGSLKTFNYNGMRSRLIARIILRALAWCMIVLACAGISWGTVSSPVQKNGRAVSFVFDVSYSMTARDVEGSFTRLEAVSAYAANLLNYAEGSPVSAVLAKGSGALAVPLTEDTNAVHALLANLSPSMLSSVGTNLGEGIMTALKSFPRSVSKAPVIWLFTDGEEKANIIGNSLLSAMNTALRQGVSVVIIGFGNENESEITAGDGKTVVKTALRSEKIQQAVDAANKTNFGEQGFKFFKGASAKYVNASHTGSAFEVLSSIKNSGETDGAADFSLSYEIQSVQRHRLFMFLAVLFFALSFIVSEFSPGALKESLAVSLILLSFTSCSGSFHESKKILEAAWNWYQKDYNEAIADFSQSLSEARRNNDELISQYALYGLSATYLMQNENAASLEKINSLSKDIPSRIQFASLYNAGIIAQRQGEYDKAAELFREALLIDSTDINAKINLEVSQNQRVQRVQEGERNISGADENAHPDSLLEKSIFNRIRENEQKQWKSLQSEQSQSSALDY